MDRPINADLLAAARAIPLPASPPRSPVTTPENVANFSRPHLVLSAFWPNEPLAWFRTAEAQFRLNNITDSQRKYDYALSRMPDDVIVQLLDLMDDLEGNNVNPYERLKERLITTFVPSVWEKARRIIKHPPLGDQRPSVLMSQMLALLPPGENAGVLFLTMFLDRLPQNIREHLATRNFDSAREMAAHADRLWDARPPDAAALAALSLEHRRSPSPSPRGRSPRRGTKRSGSPYPSQFCFYHKTFGQNARNCNPPCTWVGPSHHNNNSNSNTCFYHSRFGAAAQKCEQPCSWRQQPENAKTAGGSSNN